MRIRFYRPRSRSQKEVRLLRDTGPAAGDETTDRTLGPRQPGRESSAVIADRCLTRERARRGEPMAADCEAHLRRVKRRVAARLDAKYRRGQREHGGRLWEKPALALIEDALDEVIDLAAYLETLRDQLEHAR